MGTLTFYFELQHFKLKPNRIYCPSPNQQGNRARCAPCAHRARLCYSSRYMAARVPTKEELDSLFTRGVERCVGRDDIEKRLLAGDTLRIKLGIDPTSKNIHLGRSIPLLKLRDFQELGHQIVFIVGDFTGVIGDTSDKESERPMLSRETIAENQRTYFEQVGKLIDLSRVEFRKNSEWLETLTYREIGEHADAFSVSDFIARENIRKRLEAGKRVSLREVLYPLMQGYDSVAIRADLEVGGSDQWFNILAGRTLEERAGMQPQGIITNPLIAGLDGRKMSSSWGNTINLTDAPNDMYGKVLSLRDELIGTYFELCTRVPVEEVHALASTLASGDLHPKEAKMRLAREIVTLYHSAEAANAAEEAFVHTFAEGNVPQDIPTVHVGVSSITAYDAVRACMSQDAASNSEIRRLFTQHAIRSDDAPIEPDTMLTLPVVLKVGKRQWFRADA